MKPAARLHLISFVSFYLIVTAACANGGHRHPTSIYIPEGYVGWIRIDYGVAGQPELSRSLLFGQQYEIIPVSGLLQTSSNYGSGGATTDFYFYSENGNRPAPKEMIGCYVTFHNFEFQEPASEEKEFAILFVGSPEESKLHCQEILKYKTEEFPYFKMRSVADLPQIGNLNNGKSQ